MSELLRTSSSESAPPTPTVIQAPILWSAALEANYQKKRGRPRMDDREVVEDDSTSDAEKLRIIYKRKYARNYREKIRADLMRKEELRAALAKVEEENRQLKETLSELRQENSELALRQSSSLFLSLAALQSQLAGSSSP